MIWRNPWAWLGLLSIAVPVLIHLLTRRSARLQRFPTLRFLDSITESRARRLHLREPLLLAVRVLILTAAVAALAQPYFVTSERAGSATRVPSRVIIVDTSASMGRATESGERAVDAARGTARQIADDEAGNTRVVETAALLPAVRGAVAWLHSQAGPADIVLVSDFQTGSLDDVAIDEIPTAIGLRFERVPVRRDTAALTLTTRHGAVETEVRATLTGDRTDAEWATTRSVSGRPATRPEAGALRMITAAADSIGALAALEAAYAVGAPFASDTSRPVAIVFAGAAQHAGLAQQVVPVNRPWMGDVVARMADNTAIDRITRHDFDGREHLVLVTSTAPASLAGARLITRVLQALGPAVDPAELAPGELADEQLSAWTRPSQKEERAVPGEGSDGRWFWLLALVLIAVESWLRRRSAHVVAA